MNFSFNNIVDKLIRDKTDNTLIQFLRYGFVGGGAFIVDFVSLFIFTEYFGIYYLVSAALAFFLGILVNYYLSVSWVFKYRRYASKTIEFSLFSIIGIIGLVLNVFFIWFFTEEIGLFYLLSKMFSTVIVLFWNFFIRKVTLFKEESSLWRKKQQ